VSHRWACAAALLCAVLAGCATPPGPPNPTPELSGRLAVRVAGDAARSLSAGFALTGNAQAGQLALTSPLGTVLAQARWAPGLALLQTPDTRSEHASLDDLAEAALGERIPLAALVDWLHGRPWAGAPAQPLPAPAIGFSQLGWQVDLARHAEGWVLARREQPAPEVTVRARIEQP
jgi:outer membrane lipoprotein LolB